jgi:hypothetical protein
MSIILLKLFIAIILEAYDKIKEEENLLFNQECQDQFNLVWQDYDPDVSLNCE